MPKSKDQKQKILLQSKWIFITKWIERVIYIKEGDNRRLQQSSKFLILFVFVGLTTLGTFNEFGLADLLSYVSKRFNQLLQFTEEGILSSLGFISIYRTLFYPFRSLCYLVDNSDNSVVFGGAGQRINLTQLCNIAMLLEFKNIGISKLNQREMGQWVLITLVPKVL